MARAKGRAKGAADQRKRCKGTTKKGTACNRKPRDGTEYCGLHTPTRIHPLERVVGKRQTSQGEVDVTAHELIVQGITAGVAFKWAAQSAGISEESFYEYRAIGQEWIEAQERGEPVPEDVHRFVRFAQDVKKADGQAVAKAIAIISAAADGRQPRVVDGKLVEGKDPNWQAAAWIAERKAPQDYARPIRTEITGKDGGPIQTTPTVREDLSRLTVAEREQWLELQAKMQPKETKT